jgi:acyl carrier protein
MNTNSTDTPAARFRRCLPEPARNANEETRLADLPIDSIDTVDFLCAVHEEFGVRLNEADFRPDQTLHGLLLSITKR